MRPRSLPLAFALLVLGGGTALAHPGHQDVAGFASGMLHPLTGLDHLLAMAAVGLLAGRIGGRAMFIAPLAFVCGVAAGLMAGLAGADLPGAELLVAASVAILGLALAQERVTPGLLLAAAAGLFGLAHGFVHGVEAPGSGPLPLYAAGLLAATMALHGSGIGLALILRHDDRLALLCRAGGCAMALYGAVLVVAAT